MTSKLVTEALSGRLSELSILDWKGEPLLALVLSESACNTSTADPPTTTMRLREVRIRAGRERGVLV